MLQWCTPKYLCEDDLRATNWRSCECNFLIEEESRSSTMHKVKRESTYYNAETEHLMILVPPDSTQEMTALYCTTALRESIIHKLIASHHWLLMVACNVLSKNCVIFWVSQAMNSTSDKQHFKEYDFKAVSIYSILSPFLRVYLAKR